MYDVFLKSNLEKASDIARKNFGNAAGVRKSEDQNQVLTQTDITIGELLISSIEKEYPSYNIIDEEKGVIDKGSEYSWVIDPIDGTSNFAAGIPMYGIYIGLLKTDRPIAGAIALPSFSAIYTAQIGQGAWCGKKRINVTNQEDLSLLLIAYGIDGFPEGNEKNISQCLLLANIIPFVRNIRMSNSAYDGAMVAQGNYGAWICSSSKVWDNVALQCIIEEAGGVYTDIQGKPISYASVLTDIDKNFTYCTGAPKVHKKLQEIIHKEKQKL